MADPSLEIQQGQYGVLKAAGIRAYDAVPDKPIFDYVTIGDGQELADEALGYGGSEIVSTLHLWTRSGLGKVGIKTLADTIRRLLAPPRSAGDAPPFALVSHQLVNWWFVSAIWLDDPDGVTKHGVLILHYLTNPQS